MAAGKISIQANDGKVAGVVFEDGASDNVALTLPKEGGMLAVDTKVVHKTGDETIAGVKTFSSSPSVPNATTATQAIAYGQAVKNTGNETKTGTMTFMDDVGAGVTPITGAGKLQMLNTGSLGFQGQYGYIWANAKYTDTYRYSTSAPATSFEHSNGSFLWRTAPSGTAGTPITWTNAMTLGSNGNLLIGTTTDNGVDKLQVNGSIISKRKSGTTVGETLDSRQITSNSLIQLGTIGVSTRSVLVEIQSTSGIHCFPIYPFGGISVAWVFNYMNPGTGQWTHSSGINMTFTEQGLYPNTYSFIVSSGSALATIQATTYNSPYTVSITTI